MTPDYTPGAPDERQLAERCTAADHAALKADEATFYAGTRGGYLWEGKRYRNCARCLSTLTRDPDTTEDRS